MKKILVTVKQVMEVPDSFELGHHLQNASDWTTMKVGKKISIPELKWCRWEDSEDGSMTQEDDEKLQDRLDAYDSINWSMTEFPMNYEVPTEC